MRIRKQTIDRITITGSMANGDRENALRHCQQHGFRVVAGGPTSWSSQKGAGKSYRVATRFKLIAERAARGKE